MADARQQYEDSLNFMAGVGKSVAQILDMLADYIEANIRYAPQREMARWIKSHGQCCAYTIKGKCINELKQELNRQGIPYIDVMDDSKIIIKYPDLEQVNDINRDILIGKANYFQEVDAQALENAIASSSRIPDKEILTIHGLNKYECEVLKNKCNDITRGFMVGVTKESGGLYSISIHAPKTYSSDIEKTDFCKAYTEMAFSLYGLNAELKVAQVDADEKIDEKVRSLKGCEETNYIIGVDDPSKYIELNSSGFELHRVRMYNGEIRDTEAFFINKDDPNYEVELQKCMDTIYNKAVISDEQMLLNHLNTKKRNIDTRRPEKDMEQVSISSMEDNVTDRLNFMIKTGERAQEMENASPDVAFTIYQQEASKILQAVMDGKDIPSYKKEDIDAVKKEFSDIKADPKAYMTALGALGRAVIDRHMAKRIEKSAPDISERNVREYGNNDDR